MKLERGRRRIVVVGSSNTDLVIACDELPKPGETKLGGQFQQNAGGKGANQAVAAARAGAQVTFVGAHGDDEFGRLSKAGLKREGIDVRYFRESKKISSGIALILVGGKSRENLIAVARSANDSVSADDVAAAEDSFRKADAILCQLEIPLRAVEAAARLGQKYHVPFILNPAPARKLPSALLRLVHTLTPNEHEAEILTGERDPALAAEKLRQRGCKNVVVTLGSRGALVCDENHQSQIPAQRVKPVDTVGGGDCFSAWLTLGIAEGLDLNSAVRRAVRAASIAVTRPGAQNGMPRRREV